MNMVFPCDKPKTLCNKLLCIVAWIGFLFACILAIGGLIFWVGCLMDCWSIQINFK